MKTIMVATLFYTKSFDWYGNKGGSYNRHYMLDFPLFMAVPSAYYHLTTEDKY